MSWQIERLDRSLGEWRADWDALNQRLYKGHPFRDSRFVEPLLQHFGQGCEHLCIHRTEGRIDGMLIFCARGFGIWRQFVPDQAQAAPALLENAALLKTLFAALSPFAWMIELLCQDPQFVPRTLIEEDETTRVLQHALTMNIDLKGEFASYWSERPKKLVQNMRRYGRRVVEAFGTPQTRVIKTPEAMRDAVARYGELESAGWKGGVGTAIHIDNPQGAFYAELMLRFAETERAEVVEYWLNDKLAASRLVVHGGGLVVMLKTAYDESLAKFAPGRLLLEHFLARAFAEKRSEFVEFYTDATPDQLAWATGQRYIQHAMFFRSPFFSTLYDTAYRVKQKLFTRGSQLADEDNLNIHYCERIDALPKDNERLFQAGEETSFDLSSDWFPLLEPVVSKANARVVYVGLESNQEMLAVLPLLRRTGLLVKQTSGLSNFYTSLYRPLLSPAVTIEQMATLLRQMSSEMPTDVWRFDAMDVDHPSYALLESALQQTGFRTYRFFGFGNWYLPVENRTFDEYFQGLSSQLRNTVRRREKKFFADGRGALKIIAGVDGLEEAITAWDKIYRASWKIKEPFPEFVPDLIRVCAERGWLRLGLAYYDGVAVAAQLWIVSHGRAAIYKLAYDEKFSQLSAGTVLTAKLMRHALDVDKVREVDYLVGDDAYKKDWMKHRRERWGMVAFNLRTPAGVCGAGIESVRRLAKRVIAGLQKMIKSVRPQVNR